VRGVSSGMAFWSGKSVKSVIPYFVFFCLRIHLISPLENAKKRAHVGSERGPGSRCQITDFTYFTD
jgi:hypothetical protein